MSSQSNSHKSQEIVADSCIRGSGTCKDGLVGLEEGRRDVLHVGAVYTREDDTSTLGKLDFRTCDGRRTDREREPRCPGR